MAAYGLRGTPTTILLDRRGQVRRQLLGQVDELALGAEIARLLGEGGLAAAEGSGCSADGCVIA